MIDRVVEHPNRYKLVPVDGTTDTYDLVAVPGTVTAAGTDLNKANLLSDDTVTAIQTAVGSTLSNAVPDKALAAIAGVIGTNGMEIQTGSYQGTGTYGSENPNELTFGFTPKIWGIYIRDFGSTFDLLSNLLVFGVNSPASGTMIEYQQGSYNENFFSYSGKTVSWYSSTGARQQLNSGKYYFFAIK